MKGKNIWHLWPSRFQCSQAKCFGNVVKSFWSKNTRNRLYNLMYFEELNFAFHEKSYLWFKVDRFLFPMILCRTLLESSAKKKTYGIYGPVDFNVLKRPFFKVCKNFGSKNTHNQLDNFIDFARAGFCFFREKVSSPSK